jgi:ComF family protein
VGLAATAARLLLDPVLAVVFPSRCPACASSVERPRGGPLCEACWAGLPQHRDPCCGCGVPLPAGGTLCGRCRRGLSPFTAGASLGPYDGALRVAVHELKYRSRRRVAGRLSETMLGLPRVRAVLAGAATLVPVPLHPRRKRKRGFNQSELLARELAGRAGIRTAPDALVRRKDTPPQTGLSAAARRANVRGAFAVRHVSQVAGRAVVLVDDVLTTGATASACARALLDAGAREVRLLTVARVV